MMRSGLLGLLLVMGVTACGGQSPPAVSSSAGSIPITASGSQLAALATPSAQATANPTPVATPKPTPAPTPKPTPICLASQLGAKVTSWQGAAGHQIASVTLTSTSSHLCTVQGTPEVELVDANSGILIDSQTGGPGGLPHIAPGAPAFHLSHGGSLTTMVQVGNYCGAAPALPTTVAFVLPASAGRLVAAPGPGGSTPPCLGSPGSLGSIFMNGWRK
jgi:hypothetical protein